MRTLIVTSILAGALASCDTGPKSSRGFTLPEGDVSAGQAVFTSMECTTCHNIDGLPELRDGIDPEMTIELGGKTVQIATYGELVTSIINPSHKLAKGYPFSQIVEGGESKMTNYNDVLTVSQLIDLVAFLQAQYELIEYPKTEYYPYSYR